MNVLITSFYIFIELYYYYQLQTIRAEVFTRNKSNYYYRTSSSTITKRRQEDTINTFLLVNPEKKI